MKYASAIITGSAVIGSVTTVVKGDTTGKRVGRRRKEERKVVTAVVWGTLERIAQGRLTKTTKKHPTPELVRPARIQIWSLVRSLSTQSLAFTLFDNGADLCLASHEFRNLLRLVESKLVDPLLMRLINKRPRHSN